MQVMKEHDWDGGHLDHGLEGALIVTSGFGSELSALRLCFGRIRLRQKTKKDESQLM